MKLLTQKELQAKYGNPCRPGNHVVINLPYPMRLAWDKSKTVTKATCHKLVAQNFLNVFNDLLKHYGLAKIQELGIDLFGGIYNCRPMRGGTTFSTHAYAVAIDLHPEANGLHTPFNKSLFSKPEYKKLHEIFEKHGFINLGKVIGRDTMHWQINK